MPSKGEQTRDDIIEAAKSLFYRRGYAHTSFSDIVATTGIQRGNIYHYFKTKDEILDAVIQQRVSEYRSVLDQWERSYSDPRERLHSFVQMVAMNKGDLTRYGCPIGTLNTELGKETFELQDAARALFDLFRDWLAEQFRLLGNARQARAHALHLLGRTEGISIMGHVYNDPALITAEVKILQQWIDAL